MTAWAPLQVDDYTAALLADADFLPALAQLLTDASSANASSAIAADTLARRASKRRVSVMAVHALLNLFDVPESAAQLGALTTARFVDALCSACASRPTVDGAGWLLCLLVTNGATSAHVLGRKGVVRALLAYADSDRSSSSSTQVAPPSPAATHLVAMARGHAVATPTSSTAHLGDVFARQPGRLPHGISTALQ